MDEHVNLFERITKEEQIELSDILDNFLQIYENKFFDQLTGDIEEDSDNLEYEFGKLYRMVKVLEDRALN